jgi:hypothetical protein
VPYFCVVETVDTNIGLYSWASFQVLHDFTKPGAWSFWPQNGADPYGTWWDRDLGAPLATATQNGAVWTRKFEKATVTVDTSAGTATVA